VARPRTFDADDALEAAMFVFWRRGYEATSIGDLVEATGVNRSSLYANWRDKDGLYRAALSRYGERAQRDWLGQLRTGGGAAIERYFRVLTDASQGPGRGMSCFVLNTAAERTAHDAAIASATRALVDEVQEALTTALGNAVEAGDLPPRTDVDAHGAHLALAIQAVLLQSKTQAPRATVDAFVDLTLAALQTPRLLQETP